MLAPVRDSYAFFYGARVADLNPVESLGMRLTLQGGCALNYCFNKVFGGSMQTFDKEQGLPKKFGAN